MNRRECLTSRVTQGTHLENNPEKLPSRQLLFGNILQLQLRELISTVVRREATKASSTPRYRYAGEVRKEAALLLDQPRTLLNFSQNCTTLLLATPCCPQWEKLLRSHWDAMPLYVGFALPGSRLSASSRRAWIFG